MPPRYRHQAPVPTLSFWRPSGKQWTAEKEGIEELIAASAYSEEELKRRLGAAYSQLSEVLSGKPVDAWTAKFFEYSLSRQEERKTETWTPK